MLRPSAAFGPVRAPAIAIEVPSAHSALPSPAGSTGLPAAAAGTSAPSMSIWTEGTMITSPEPPSVSVDVLVSSSPPWDWGPQAVRTRVAARSRAAPPLARRAVRCMPTSVVLIPAEGRQAASPRGRSLNSTLNCVLNSDTGHPGTKPARGRVARSPPRHLGGLRTHESAGGGASAFLGDANVGGSDFVGRRELLPTRNVRVSFRSVDGTDVPISPSPYGGATTLTSRL